jgi:hypothetical protein
MEAFILADRVVTAQHMGRVDHHELKYVKRYDLPTRSCNMTATPRGDSHPRTPLARSPPAHSRKLKNLLSSLGSALQRRRTARPKENARIDKFFSAPPQRHSPDRKGKSALLIRRVNPRCQQYDANMGAVTHKSPAWTFTPHGRLLGQTAKCRTQAA